MRSLALVLVVLLAAPAFAQRRKKPPPPPPPPAVEEPVQVRQPRRFEFQPQDVKGAFNKTAVFLYDRKPLREQSMVKERDSFRDEIYGSL